MARELVDCMPTASADEWYLSYQRQGGGDVHHMLARLDEEVAAWSRTYMLAPLSSPRRHRVIDTHLLDACGLVRVSDLPQYIEYKASSLATVLNDCPPPHPRATAQGMLRLLYLRQALFILPNGMQARASSAVVLLSRRCLLEPAYSSCVVLSVNNMVGGCRSRLIVVPVIYTRYLFDCGQLVAAVAAVVRGGSCVCC